MQRLQIADLATISDTLRGWGAKARKSTADFQWKEAIIHPFVFAVYPILSLYAKNMGKGFLREALGIATGVLVLALLLWLLVWILAKDRRRSAVIISALFMLFFSYGHAISASGTLLEKLHLLGRFRFLVEGSPALGSWLAVWGFLFAAVIGVVLRVKSDFLSVTKFLNIVALVLALMVGANLVAGGVNVYLPAMGAEVRQDIAHRDADQASTDLRFQQCLPLVVKNHPDKAVEDETVVDELVSSWQEELTKEGAQWGSSPDIYYIIVDAYARADILEEVYRFDNSEFLSYLGDTGFYVADRSTANYPQTALSLSSSLNFMYLDDLVDRIGTGTSNRQPLEVMIRDSKVFRYLRNRGYKIIAFSSGYGPTDIVGADIYMAPPKPWDLTEFQEALVMVTPLSMFQKVRSDFRRDRITYALDHIADAAEIDTPTLVFVHVTAPHFPFIFDADGKPIEPPRGIGDREDYEDAEYIAGYRDQLVFISRRLRSAIDAILSGSSDAPIIILQSDHGPSANLGSNWDIQETYLAERMSILNAYYFPDQDYETLYEDITPVNTFRILLNKYFGRDYELLEDRCYFSSWEQPYLLRDVTDEVLAGH